MMKVPRGCGLISRSSSSSTTSSSSLSSSSSSSMLRWIQHPTDVVCTGIIRTGLYIVVLLMVTSSSSFPMMMTVSSFAFTTTTTFTTKTVLHSPSSPKTTITTMSLFSRPKRSNYCYGPRSTTTTTTPRYGPLSLLPSSSSSIPSSSSSSLHVAADIEFDIDMPPMGNNGVYNVMDERQYKALIEHHKDQLIVLKVFAPWCKACKGLEPKFNAMVRDQKYENLPIVWADLTIQNNKEFVKSIGVLALPTIQFYARGQRMETFACGPSKVPILKRKLVQFINEHVDPKTYRLKDVVEQEGGAGGLVDDETSTMSTTDAATPLVVFPEETILGNETLAGVTDTTTTTTTAGAASDAASLAAAAAESSETIPKAQDILSSMTSPPPTVQPPVPVTGSTGITTTTTATTPPPRDTIERVVEREKSLLRGIKYLSDLLESEFVTILSRASLLTFESGSIIMKEGNPGRTFYILLNGEVEICQRTSFEDPLTTPPSYLGTVINRLENKGEYFGERSLITGEVRAASIRASRRTTCLAIDRDDFPITSVLSGRVSAIDEASKARVILEVNDKYGMSLLDFEQINEEKQYQDSITASQVRGSPNQPGAIDGVDNDKEVPEYEPTNVVPVNAGTSTGGELDESTPSSSSSLGVETATIVPLLFRFKLIRSITRCFDYIVENRLQFGDAGTRRRRSMLVNLLSSMQRQEISEAFRLIDDNGDGEVTLMELRRIMDSVGEERSDEDLHNVIQQSRTLNGAIDERKGITAEDFTGLMAEAEIYHLFLDTFRTLDPNDTGFVRAKDLDRVLRGVRDLIRDDRHSIIDVEDIEMMVDYEQFARMLLGAALKS